MLALTYRCNAHCTMCDVWRLSDHGYELEPELFAKFPTCLRNVNITGGEPFMRKEIAQIIGVLRKSNPKLRMVISTNGLAPKLIRTRIDDVIQADPKIGLRISIDGIGKYQQVSRGMENAFEKCLESMEILKSKGIKDLGFSYTAGNFNTDQIRAVHALAEKWKVQFTFCGISHNSEFYFTKDRNKPIEDLNVLGEQLDYVRALDLKSFNPKRWFRAFYESGVVPHASTGTRDMPCFAGTSFFFMEPDGSIVPDPVLHTVFGNIRDQDFEELWYSDTAVEFREKIANVHQCPNQCWMSCTVAPWMRKNKVKVMRWIFKNKLKAHLGMSLDTIT